MSTDLQTVINDAIDDQAISAVPQPEDLSTPTDTPTDPTPGPYEATADTTAPDPVQGASPAVQPTLDSALAPEEDEFAKRYGLPSQRPGERENRIPYSAVKRIVGNAEKRASEPLTKELTEVKARINEYEGRLQQVAQFEQVMMSNPDQFLSMLAQIPAYRQIFQQLSGAASGGTQAPPQETDADPMPQPDETLGDGTKVYSMEGVQNLLDWKARQVETKVTSTFDKRLAPFEKELKEREYQRYIETTVVPKVQGQIEAARQWPQFTEHEPAIVKALQDNPNLSLEGAYVQVVVPRLTSGYNSVRARVLDEVSKAPLSTSVTPGATRPGSPTPSGPRNLKDVINEAIAGKG